MMKKRGSFFAPPRNRAVRRHANPRIVQNVLNSPFGGSYALEHARARLKIISVIFACLFSIIAGRLIFLTLVRDSAQPTTTRFAVQDSMIQPKHSADHRRDLVDRNGVLLATSVTMQSLCVDTHAVVDKGELSRGLKRVLPNLSPTHLQNALASNSRCAVLKRHLTPREVQAVNNLGLAGLEFQDDDARMWPLGAMTAHVVGFTDVDGNGLSGLEKGLEAQLHERNPTPIQTTLDVRVQAMVREVLTESVQTFRAKSATAVLMEAKTGAVVALVSLPDYDPRDSATVIKALRDTQYNNHASADVYEMGSTFKVFTLAAALDAGLVAPADLFDVSKPLMAGGHAIRDFHPLHRRINVAEILTESSNIGAAQIGLRLGEARQRAFLQNLGLLDRSALEIPEVGSPIVPSAQNWGRVTTMTAAFGHGIAVSAVQMTAGVASIVNGGIRVMPTLLKKTDDAHNNTNQENATFQQKRVVNTKTSTIMRAMMRLVVKDGTAKSANVSGYLVGGKTGTTNKLQNGRYLENARLASFVGVFPIADPRWVVLVTLDDPRPTEKTYGFATGGWTAAPAAGAILTRLAVLMGVPPTPPDVLAQEEADLLAHLGDQTLSAFIQ